MVKYLKYIIILTLVATALIIALNLFKKTSPEEQIKERLNEFLIAASKSSGDKLSTGLIKSKRLEGFFAPSCSFQIGVSSFSGKYSPEDISANSMRCRTIFKYVTFSAHDVEIKLTSPTTATVDFTGALNGTTKRGETIDNYKELTCNLRLIGDKWLIYAVSIREIIKK